MDEFVTTLMLILLLFAYILIFQLMKQINSKSIFEKSKGAPELEIGSSAPVFTTQTLDNKSFSSRDQLGEKTIYVFVSSGCKACHTAIPNLNRLAPAAKQADNANIVIVVENEYQVALNLRTTYNISMPILVSPRESNPHTWIYNPQAFYPYYCIVDEKGVNTSISCLKWTTS